MTFLKSFTNELGEKTKKHHLSCDRIKSRMAEGKAKLGKLLEGVASWEYP